MKQITTQSKTLIACIMLLLAAMQQTVSAQTGYIYVHLKSINEENSTNFPFTLTNSLGISINSFSLNDEATANNVALSGVNVNVYDMGLSHGLGGDGQLWVVAGSNFSTPATYTAGTIYYRNPQSSQWNPTTITNAYRLDGAYANQFVYINSSHNVIFYNNGTQTTIYSNGDAWDVTANGGQIAISTASAIKLYSKPYSAGFNISAGGTWTTLTSPGNICRLDMNLAGTTIVYQPYTSSNTAYTVTTAGATASLGSFGIGAASNADVAYDDNGVIYANANNTTYTDLIYHYSGGMWSAETQSRSLSTLTGGAAHLVYATDVAGGATIESIYSRQCNSSGNIYWIDDERVKNSSSLNGNGIIIPVAPGTYTLTETLPNSTTYDLGRYNIYDPGGATTGNVGTQVVTFVVTAGEVVFAEYINEKLDPYKVSFTTCNATYYVQTFDASNSSPNYVTPTYGTTTSGTPSYGSPFPGTAYHYSNVANPQDGYYYLVNMENASDWFVNTNLQDHTGNNGFFLLVNASYSLDEFYRQRLTNLIVGNTYTVSYWTANVNPPPALIYPNIKIGVQDSLGLVVSSASTGNITSTAWTQYSLTFTATTSTTDLFLSNNNVGGYGNDLAIDDITITTVCSTLPVTLINFTAQKQNSSTMLNWTTTSQVNFDHFEVERSADAVNWANIGIVLGQENSHIENDYKFPDQLPLNGINYYRLKMVDVNGSIMYSEVRTVDFINNEWSVSMFPNPVSAGGLVKIQSNEPLQMIRVFDVNGKLVFVENIAATETQGNSSYSVNTNNLPQGMYLVQVANSNGKKNTLKLMKKN